MHEDKPNVMVVKEVGALAGERLIQFAPDGAQNVPEPDNVWFSLDGSLLSSVSSNKRELHVYDLTQDPGRDEEKNPLPIKEPLISLVSSADIVVGGFAATRSDDIMVVVRTEAQERLWNITHVVAQSRQKRLVY